MDELGRERARAANPRSGAWVVAIRLRQLGDAVATLAALQEIQRSGRRVAYVVDRVYHPLLAQFDCVDQLIDSPPRVSGPARVAAYVHWIKNIRTLQPEAVLDFHGSWRTALVSCVLGAPRRVGYQLRGRGRLYHHAEPRECRRAGVVVPQTSSASAVGLARVAGVASSTSADGARCELPTLPHLSVSVAARNEAARAMRAAGVPVDAVASGRVLGVNPGRAYPAKGWAADRWSELARRLVKAGWTVVVLWGPGEETGVRRVCTESGTGVYMAPQTPLSGVPGLLALLRGVITIDSGLKHLAVCVGTPTVTLFGATDPREWHMGGENDVVLWKGLSCSPCRLLTCPFGAPCMDFSVGDVEHALFGSGKIK